DYVTLDDLQEKHRVRIMFVEEEFQDTPAGKLTFGLKILLAKHFIDNLRSEVLKGMTQKAESGVYPTRPPYGYRNVRINGVSGVEVDPERAEHVHQLYTWYASGEVSITDCAQRFNATFRQPMALTPIARSKIESMLKDGFYVGRFVWRGKTYQGTQETFLPKTLFDQVQAVFAGHNRPRQQHHDFAWSGYLVCGHCGCAITAEVKKGKYVYYHCAQSKGKCVQPWVREEALEERLGEWVKKVTISEELLNVIRKTLKDLQAQKKEFQEQETGRLQARYRLLQERLDRAYEDKLDGKIAEDLWERKSAAWQSELAQVRLDLANFESANKLYVDEALRIFELAQKAHPIWVRSNSQEKRRLLVFASSNCTLVDGSPAIKWRRPFDLLAEGPSVEDWYAQEDDVRTFLGTFVPDQLAVPATWAPG
ncbi:recombinase zinc beta ribbon domain-containing protein, partial [Candidatus Micrarchaeota archaeon]|nr:recombinase zinc beta ribbon domain-containing protein [Candidatus Micrarchaeota archaeon]